MQKSRIFFHEALSSMLKRGMNAQFRVRNCSPRGSKFTPKLRACSQRGSRHGVSSSCRGCENFKNLNHINTIVKTDFRVFFMIYPRGCEFRTLN